MNHLGMALCWSWYFNSLKGAFPALPQLVTGQGRALLFAAFNRSLRLPPTCLFHFLMLLTWIYLFIYLFCHEQQEPPLHSGWVLHFEFVLVNGGGGKGSIRCGKKKSLTLKKICLFHTSLMNTPWMKSNRSTKH